MTYCIISVKWQKECQYMFIMSCWMIWKACPSEEGKFLQELPVEGGARVPVPVCLIAAWRPSRHGIPPFRIRARLAQSNKKPPVSASGSTVTIFYFILRCHSAADQETESDDNPVCHREHGQRTCLAHSHGKKPCNFHW